ncbi:hypothetical protein L207DRAFT_565768 [Hyaloscypha variabilis F]|uniref:Heterokaryon incompatibility domain-containing protein n=1 Tax=Hyaloscypha variabilis (strain UAMH 11265 / GT02V1 / F) TaxID=1149755 RepID=A0A2J6RP24_HYAVF|nr:hypothetical protein L207DRAFT_565768 [Hyaloscypha variabilis F]
MRQRYPYQPLQGPEHQIRLLTILPGEFPLGGQDATPIEIQFQTISFGDFQGPVPKYEALSYVWGEDRSPDPVLVKSEASEQSFIEVTQNLATALVYLRHATVPRVLWIDALCVNQMDINERSSQVSRMANIYRKADRVVVWLGPESVEDCSAQALSTLRDIGSRMEVNWELRNMRATDQEDSSWADLNVPLRLHSRQLEPVLKLLSRSWFERVWVQQEIILATNTAVLVCGHDSIMRQHFTNAIYYLDVKPRNSLGEEAMFRERLALTNKMATNMYASEKYVDILRDQAKTLKCLDARDRVFAILNIGNPFERRGNIEADYSKTTEDVYRDFTISQIINSNKLDFLTACELQNNHGVLPQPIPSWVPDWRRPVLAESLCHQHASGQSVAAARIHSNGEQLSLMGVKCATVTRTQLTSFRELSKADMIEFASSVKQCFQFWTFPEKEMSRENAHDACLRTLCGDLFSHHWRPQFPEGVDVNVCSTILDWVLMGPYKENNQRIRLPTKIGVFIGHVIRACYGRACFTTMEGYIGVGPTSTKIGDIICVLLGCAVPLVLRPIREGKFSVVGECYCDELMNGAALLGPLPKEVDFVHTWVQERGVYRPAYINRRNGKVQGEDPRLAGHALPPGWRIEEHSEDGVNRSFVEENHNGTEKRWADWEDPRMRAEELRKRGVDVVSFDLI